MGNLSTGGNVKGVPRTLIRLPGVLVRAEICIPKAHAHALWLLPWVEALLSGKTLEELLAVPPWPLPNDVLIARHLRNTLIDLRWAVPDWAKGGVVVAPALVEAFHSQGRAGLARTLFEAELSQGEWWADGLAGTLLSRQTVTQFDWDHRREAKIVFPMPENAQALVDASEPDLFDLIRKLGGLEDLWAARDRAFLATPLTVGERKDILFPLFGDDIRLLPDELAELEPALQAHSPELFGQKKTAASRVVHLPRSPVEQVIAELELLPSDPVKLGPVAPVQERIARLQELVEGLRPDLGTWLRDSHEVRPVVGPTQRHFDAISEVCAALPAGKRSLVLLTSAFLNVRNADQEDGLADAFAQAPDDTRFLVIYGHANDDLPEQQNRDMEAWRSAIEARRPALTRRLTIVAGKRRSHEKVVVSSAGDWMIGSWNPTSSRAHATVLEASLAGRSGAFALELLGHISNNVEGAEGEAMVAALKNTLPSARGGPPAADETVTAFVRSLKLLERALPEADGSRAGAWSSSIRAVRSTTAPLLTRARLQVVDEQQTRDAFLAYLRSARRDVLVASDRLADSGLDRATLLDLQGDGRTKRIVRVVWGREWAGQSSADKAAREQIKRAQRTVRDAKDLLGEWFCTSDEPMENHAKLLIVDGLRGLVTSENLLSFGGEKGRYESRELGVTFWSPVVARHLLGRLVLQWPEALDASSTGHVASPLAWAVAGNEVWHGLSAVEEELGFDWQAPAFIEAAVRDEIENERASDQTPDRKPDRWARLVEQAGHAPFSWVRDEAERLGLVQPAEQWSPYDAPASQSPADLITRAERDLAALPPRKSTTPAPVRVPSPGSLGTERPTQDPIVARVLADMKRIPAGRFWMGDDRVREEYPRHPVRISRPFLLGRTPVTQGLWEAVMGRLPHLRDIERHPEFPIIQVSPTEMDQFVTRLNQLPGAGSFELPTEAQWEYACLAGADTIYCFGDDPGFGDRPGLLEQYAWTKRNSRVRLEKVGQLLPNAWGLHDMHGLVYETMRDGFRTYSKQEVTDPVGPVGDGRIVARGGFWGRFPIDGRNSAQEHFRCAARQFSEKSHRVSLRLACRIEEQP